jgi:hypothetical protein
MDEKQMARLISTIDNELFIQELDGVMDEMNLEIDMESIAEKARWKLRKEQQRVKLQRRKILAVIAASLVLVLGAGTVYAAEISAFIQSLLGKTGVYSTVVDGSAYYLESPIALEDGHSLTQVVLTEKELALQFDTGWKVMA